MNYFYVGAIIYLWLSSAALLCAVNRFRASFWRWLIWPLVAPLITLSLWYDEHWECD